MLTVAITLVGLDASAATPSPDSVFPGRNVLFLLTLAILMVPYATLLIPLYVLLKRLGLQNSLLGLALVLAMFQLPFATFMMRISFEAVPREIEESALVDGCGHVRACCAGSCCRRCVPGSSRSASSRSWRPGTTSSRPLILLSDDAKPPLPLAIATLRQQTMGVIDYGATEAGVMVMAMPCLLLFLLLQRHYVRGFMSGARQGMTAAG